MTELISASEIIERAAERGYVVTQTQLSRWHRAELLPQLARVHPGRGSVSMYPAMTVEYAVQIAALLKHHRDLDWVGWKLWMFGFEVPERFWRDSLKSTFGSYRTAADKFLTVFDAADDAEHAEIVHAVWSTEDAPDIFKRIRKTVGKDDFGLFLVMIVSLLEGEFSGLSIDQSSNDPEQMSAARFLDRGLGLFRARTDYLEGGSPWLTGDYSNILSKLAPVFSKLRDDDFFDLQTSNDLIAAREELMYLRMFIAGIAEHSRTAYGDANAFGLKLIARLLSITDREWEAGLLSIWLIARTHAPLRENARNWIKLQLELKQKSDAEVEPRALLQTKAVFPFKPSPK